MMKQILHCRLAVILVLSLLAVRLCAQYPVTFTHIGLEQGLSQSTVYDIAQDRQGNLWMATQNGLNRYNGYDITVYHHRPGDPASLGNDVVRTCFFDRQQRLWIGTNEGLSLYDPTTERFRNFAFREGDELLPVSSIVEADDHLLLLCVAGRKLLAFDTDSLRLCDRFPAGIRHLTPTTLYRYADRIYVAAFEGLFVHTLRDGLTTPVAADDLAGTRIYALLHTAPGCLWVGTEGRGLYRLDLDKRTTRQYLHRPGEPGTISSDYIRSLCLDSQNRLWVGSLHGLNLYDSMDHRFTAYAHDPLQEKSLSQNSVRCIFRDVQGGLWLGTYHGGINYYHPLCNRFANLRPIPRPDALNSGIIGPICQDGEGLLWIGTNSREMYVLDAEGWDDPAPADSRPPKLLVVEDNAEIRHYLAEQLGQDYAVLTATNGREALEVLQSHADMDLILTDVMMPVMDGLQLCRQVKQNLSTCHIPVIILSAKTELGEQMEGLQQGADDYIPKPFAMPLVRTKIRNLFRTRRRAIDHYTHSLDIEPEQMALNPLDEELLKRAVAAVERHMDDVDFNTDAFAREMCMSRSNLHLKMKALTGESAGDFIRKMRFNQAAKLLKEGRYTVAEVSTMVGFNTPSYFATCFKKFFGCLPSEYGKSGEAGFAQH